jgi:hypothetical protein
MNDNIYMDSTKAGSMNAHSKKLTTTVLAKNVESVA